MEKMSGNAIRVSIDERTSELICVCRDVQWMAASEFTHIHKN